MQLKYHDDIKWQDLPKIERPFFAQSTIKYELSRPWPRLRKGLFNDPLSQIYRPFRNEIDPVELNRLLKKVEEGSVLLVHTFEENVSYPAFIWRKDDNHPDKGHWTLSEQLYSASEYHFNLLLNTVKKPQQRGSIKTAAITTAEYGYIPSANSNAATRTQSTGVGEITMTEAAKTLGQFLYKIGSRSVILATLTPSSAGGTTTYAIANQPDIRIIESDLEPARYQRRVDGEWQTTGIQAMQVVDEGRVMGFEALSPEESTSLKSTGGIPIAPQAKPTIEGYPPDNPPDSSRLVFPDQQGQIDNSKLSFPAEGPGPMESPGFNQGTDVRDVVGPPVMYNQSGDGDLNAKKGIVSNISKSAANKDALKIISDPEFIKRVEDVNCTDCDDLAKLLYKASGDEGSILDFTTSSGTIKIKEFGVVEEFIDHRVYSDGNFVFDPRYSKEPVPVSDFVNDLKELNPELIIKDVTP